MCDTAATVSANPDRPARYVTACLTALLFFLAGCTAADPTPSPRDTVLTVLTLNLHTYQEIATAGVEEQELTQQLAAQRVEAYGPIFDRMAAGISELDPDVICLQEVGEWPSAGHDDPAKLVFGGGDSNMVQQILARLPKQHYEFTMDWSHFGWGVWMEGSAILSKFPLTHRASRFISSPANKQPDNWKSRNVPMARIDVPEVGAVQVFSVHAGWWNDPEEPFQVQFRRLLDWAAEVERADSTTILCGDFNVAAGGPGYAFLSDGTGFTDQYALANPAGMFDATIGGGADGWERSDGGQRIDYILLNDTSPLAVTTARRVFTDEEFGRVSDHVGVYAEFMIKRGQ